MKNKKPQQSLETRLSKFASKVLRHEPQYLNLELDKEGWVSINKLLTGFERKGLIATKQDLIQMVKNNDKQRFEISGDKNRIRAVQGHSIGVDLNLENKEPPEYLYHGTVNRYLQSILDNGLKRITRDFVHLSGDVETAKTVGIRRGDPIVLTIHAKKAYDKGIVFYQALNGVWLVDAVPVEFISR